MKDKIRINPWEHKLYVQTNTSFFHDKLIDELEKKYKKLECKTYKNRYYKYKELQGDLDLLVIFYDDENEIISMHLYEVKTRKKGKTSIINKQLRRANKYLRYSYKFKGEIKFFFAYFKSLRKGIYNVEVIKL